MPLGTISNLSVSLLHFVGYNFCRFFGKCLFKYNNWELKIESSVVGQYYSVIACFRLELAFYFSLLYKY